MKITQRSSGNSVSITSGGSVVVDGSLHGTVVSNGEVWINGERCYPHSLIEELDAAYRSYCAALAVGDVPPDITQRVTRARWAAGVLPPARKGDAAQ